jgi:tryptophan synthase alpha chain
VRRETDLPVVVGFGIAGPHQARDVTEFADGVAVGSALITTVADNRDRPAEAAAEFVRSLREALG